MSGGKGSGWSGGVAKVDGRTLLKHSAPYSCYCIFTPSSVRFLSHSQAENEFSVFLENRISIQHYTPTISHHLSTSTGARHLYFNLKEE